MSLTDQHEATTYHRTVYGVPMPLPGRYEIDPAHTSVSFQVQHLGISKVRGRFTDFAGVITVAEEPTASSVQVTIQAASIDTGQPQRDEHLRSPEFFHVERWPTAAFVSTGLTVAGTDARLHGDLTIAGTTQAVALALTFEGAGPDPAGTGQPRIGFTATTTIEREEFGLTYNHLLETGSWLIGKTARVELDVQALRLPD